MVDFPEFVRPSLAMRPQESINGRVEIIVSEGFAWFVLDVRRDDKYCLKESWLDGLRHGLECHLIDLPLSVIDYALMDGISWVVTPFIWSAKCWPVYIGNRRKRGRPDPVSYPSEQIMARLGKSLQNIRCNIVSICKPLDCLNVSRPCIK